MTQVQRPQPQQPQPMPVDTSSKFTPPTKGKKQVSATPFLLKLLQVLLAIAGGMLLVANIEPYIAVTRLVFPAGGDVCKELGAIPFVGGLLLGGCGVVASTLYSLSGFVVWALFQTFELLPIAANFNIPFLSGMLARLQSAPKVELADNDTDAVKATKTKINTIVERSLSTLLTWSWISYGFDLALMSWLYSPLNATGSLNPMALIRVLLGVFGVELVIMALTLINNVIDPSTIRHQSASKREVREY